MTMPAKDERQRILWTMTVMITAIATVKKKENVRWMSCKYEL